MSILVFGCIANVGLGVLIWPIWAYFGHFHYHRIGTMLLCQCDNRIGFIKFALNRLTLCFHLNALLLGLLILRRIHAELLFDFSTRTRVLERT